MPITALTDLETVEVSLVPAGANLKKRFPIMKRNEEGSMSDILHAVIDAQTSDESHFDKVAKSANLSEEAAAAVKGAMKILNAYSDMIPAEQALAVVSEGLGVKKATEFEEGKESEGAKLSDEDEDEDEEEVKELSEMITESEKATEFEEGKESEGATLADEEEDEEEDAEKAKKENPDSLQKSLDALDPAVRDQVTALWKSQKEAVAKADKLEKSLAKERDERVRKEFIAKAQTEFRFVPGKSPEELGLMLKSLYAMDSQIAKDIEGIFKSVSAMVEKGDLLDELGSSMTGEAASGSAYSKLDNIAKSRVAKSDESYAKAFEKAMRDNPGLYTDYLNEQAK
tara:strand:+ start:356 stop:1381 length:1026 start_codon:yes stop_codon:yes gene_type:complete